MPHCDSCVCGMWLCTCNREQMVVVLLVIRDRFPDTIVKNDLLKIFRNGQMDGQTDSEREHFKTMYSPLDSCHSAVLTLFFLKKLWILSGLNRRRKLLNNCFINTWLAVCACKFSTAIMPVNNINHKQVSTQSYK